VIADDVIFPAGVDEALEPLAALLALVFVEGHDGVILEEYGGSVQRPLDGQGEGDSGASEAQ
jgi:hypothetical protein